MPATIPKASSASCTMPATRRLAPDTACPAASSSTAVVRAAPGRKTTNDATMARSPGPVRSCSAASALSDDTMNAARTGRTTCRERRPADEPTQQPDQPAQDGRRRHVTGGGLQDEAQAHRERRVPEDGRHHRVARRHAGDLVEALEALGRRNLTSLRLAHELVERRDLVEPGGSAERGRDLEGSRLAPAHRDHHEGGEGADACALGAVRAGHARELLLHHVDRLAGRAQPGAELDHEGLEVTEIVTSHVAHAPRTVLVRPVAPPDRWHR